MMLPDSDGGSRNLFATVFSDEPVPDVEAAIVIAHPGDEALNASWLMVRFRERASVYCLTEDVHGWRSTVAAAGLAGVPADRCHNLGLTERDLAKDLETLVWLTTAAVTEARPRMLVTHSCNGRSLRQDAAAFAVHMTARLLTRGGGVAPVVVEFIDDPERPDVQHKAQAAAQQAVKIEFGPESRKVKRRMLQCHCDTLATLDGGSLRGESYMLANTGNPLDYLAEAAGTYLDAPWCDISAFRRHARQVADTLSAAVLSSPSRA